MFAQTQDQFAAALLDAERAVPDTVTSHTEPAPHKRFAVYRNNVVMSLINALKVRFPATVRIVGEEFFAAMAQVFVTVQPPRSPILMFYGDDFPDFIAGFPPAADLPYLADVARIEAARTRAYHAADRAPIDAQVLQAVPLQALGALVLMLHPSVEIVRSPHPAVTLWAMNSGDAELAPIEDWRGEDALIARPALDVEVRSLPAGAAAFVAALAAGVPLAAAAETALADNPQFDLAVHLAGLIGTGLIVGVAQAEPSRVPQ
jgi:Putative DNA-binding domain